MQSAYVLPRFCYAHVIMVGLLKVPRLYVWYHRKLPNCQTLRWVSLGWSRWGATKHQHCNPECAKWHDMYTHQRSVRTNECKITPILSDCVMNGFIMFLATTPLDNASQPFDVETVSQYRSAVTSAENPASENSPQSIGELGSVVDTWLI